MEADNPGPRVMKLLGVLKNKSEGEMLSATSGSAQRRKLADISNLLERAKLTNQGLKQQKESTMLPSKDYLEKLEKEKLMLMKVLRERKYPSHEIIRLSGIELQNLRISLHKLQEQNSQLAQANSKMLVELNTNKDRLKLLNHELGCKNGLLKARKMLLEEQSNPVTYQTSENEVGIAEHDEVGKSIQSDDGDNKTCNTKRRRQSIIKPSGNSVAKSAAGKENDIKNRAVWTRKNPSKPEEANSADISNETNETKDNIDSKRRCVRRQSAKFESLELELSETLPETRDAKETNNNQRQRVRRRHSARFESQEPVQNETLEEIHEAKEATEYERLSEQPTRLEVQASEPLTETMHDMHGIKETAKNSRAPVRRHSTRLKELKGEPIQDLSTIDDKKEKTMKRTSLRRQSTRSKSQEPELSETMHETQDAKEITENQGSTRGRRSTTHNPQASVEANNYTDDPRPSNFQLGDKTALERDPRPLKSLKNRGDGNRSSLETGVCEGIRRTSVGRPLRRAAEKIQTYKEISLNVKMRRSE